MDINTKYHNYFLLLVLFLWMGINLSISCKFNSPSTSTCENWPFNFSFFASPFDSPSFYALEKAENALLLAITSRRFTKSFMSILKLVKNGGAATLSSIHNMSFILTNFEHSKLIIMNEWTTLDPSLFSFSKSWALLSTLFFLSRSNDFLSKMMPCKN